MLLSRLMKYHLPRVHENLTDMLSVHLPRTGFIAVAAIIKLTLYFFYKSVCPAELPMQILFLRICMHLVP